MLSTAHTLISLPLPFYLDNPFLIFIAAVCVHLLADSIYHWNVDPSSGGVYPYAAAFTDVFIGLILSIIFLGDRFWSWPVIIAIIGGNTPDILHSVWFQLRPEQRPRWLQSFRPLFDFHEKIQHETRRVLPGLISQIAAVSIALFLV